MHRATRLTGREVFGRFRAAEGGMGSDCGRGRAIVASAMLLVAGCEARTPTPSATAGLCSLASGQPCTTSASCCTGYCGSGTCGLPPFPSDNLTWNGPAAQADQGIAAL